MIRFVDPVCTCYNCKANVMNGEAMHVTGEILIYSCIILELILIKGSCPLVNTRAMLGQRLTALFILITMMTTYDLSPFQFPDRNSVQAKIRLRLGLKASSLSIPIHFIISFILSRLYVWLHLYNAVVSC